MNSPTLLCIDDRAQMLELRKTTLESQGYSVKLASNGYGAIKTLDEASVTAVLLEYKQEGMDAEAIAYHIKQQFPNLPIILLSAYSEMPERILWLVDDYIMKSELLPSNGRTRARRVPLDKSSEEMQQLDRLDIERDSFCAPCVGDVHGKGP
jgi:CheY-like chemotaxis protein